MVETGMERDHLPVAGQLLQVAGQMEVLQQVVGQWELKLRWWYLQRREWRRWKAVVVAGERWDAVLASTPDRWEFVRDASVPVDHLEEDQT